MIVDIAIQSAKDGNLVPFWDGFQLHSIYEPEKEGISIAEKCLAQVDDFDKPLLVLGLGFAYHILPLLDKFKDIFVAESCHQLISKAKEINFMKPVFEKCQIVSELSEAPYLPEFHLLVLRSENRFQEKFFCDIQEAVKANNKSFTPELNQIRVLVNSPIYGGSYTTAQYVVSALESIGTCVRMTDHAAAEPLLMKYMGGSGNQRPEANNALIEQLTGLLSETLWHDIQAFKPHIVLFIAQSPFTDKLMKDLQKAGIVSMYWFVEDFRRFNYWKNICNSFDFFYMIQKGEFEEILQKTCRTKWGWMPVAAEPRTHKPVKITEDEKAFYGSDISFMGAAYPNRVRFFRRFNKINLKLWGTGWTEAEMPNYIIPLKNKRISTEQSNKIYQSTKININLHSANPNDHILTQASSSRDGLYESDQMIDHYGDFVNPRTFEIAACGGFQLVDDRVAVRELFDADKEIVLFSSVEEAIDKANFYLKNEDLRQKIAKAGQAKTLKLHTYELRLSNMLKKVIHHSPMLSARVLSETEKVNDFLKKINDKEFEKLINSIEPAMRCSYQAIIEKVKSDVNHADSGYLKKYEAMTMLLETFFTGE